MERTRRVLVVEPDSHVRKLICAVAASLKLQSMEAATGAEALSIARTGKLAAITLADDLPDQDWATVIQSLHSDPGTAKIPIIAIVMPGIVYKAKQQGCVAVIVKPFAAAELKSALMELAQ